MLTITPITDEAIAELVLEIHHDDAMELRAGGITDATGMLRTARDCGVMSAAAYWKGRLYCVYGVTANDDGSGVPWMLSTRYLESVPPVIVTRMARAAVDEMSRHFDVLTNWVHVEHSTAVDFVRWLGFTVGDEPVGPAGEFRVFTLERACATRC